MKKLILVLLLAVFSLAYAQETESPPVEEAPAVPVAEPETLFQVSTLDLLAAGDYDGRISLEALKSNGDFGLGTFHQLDGEMVILDDQIYQIKSDGKVSTPDPTSTSPFAQLTYFDADQTVELKQKIDFEKLKLHLDSLITDKSSFWAIKITGEFKTVQTRSVPAQEKPYPPLAEVIKTPPTTNFKKVKGTLVGFWSPEAVKGIGVPGYHFHFLTADKTKGGHLLKLELKKGKIELDQIPRLLLEIGKAI